VTWSTFNSSWAPLEYYNGTAYNNLSASPSSFFNNPISLNASDAVSPALHKPLYGSTYWNETANWVPNAGIFGFPLNNATRTIAKTTTNGMPSITLTGNSSSTGKSGTLGYYIKIPISDLPSSNFAYDYITITGYNHVQSNVAGYSYSIILENATGQGTALTAINGTSSRSTTGTAGNTPFYYTFPLTLMGTTNLSNSADAIVQIAEQWQSAVSTNDIGTITITGMALTENPLFLGSSTQNNEITAATGNSHLSSFKPATPMTVLNGGYSVAVSQPLQNITTSQTSINNGIYTESVTYQGIESLPTAPDLSYTNANITLPMLISGKQFEVANVNGISFLPEIQKITNGTFSFGSVNANSQNSIILEVEYTASQWDSVSAPPSFWTEPIQAIEYYWYIALGVLLGAIGLGSWAGSKSDALRGVKK
jgi:hypothetical protein